MLAECVWVNVKTGRKALVVWEDPHDVRYKYLDGKRERWMERRAFGTKFKVKWEKAR